MSDENPNISEIDEDDDVSSIGAGEAETDNEEVGYEFVSSGESCPRCEALDGVVFELDPELPHPGCDCEVRQVGFGGNRSTDCENGWSIENTSLDRYGPQHGEVISHWKITVECWDGSVYEAEAAIDHGASGFNLDTYEDEAWNELYDDAQEIAAAHCSPCQPWTCC